MARCKLRLTYSEAFEQAIQRMDKHHADKLANAIWRDGREWECDTSSEDELEAVATSMADYVEDRIDEYLGVGALDDE